MEDIELLKIKLATEKDIKDAIFCTIEEMSELTKVLTKYLRNSSKFSIEDLSEELAHSLMTLELIKNMFYISDECIKNEQLNALKRCFGIE